MACSKYRYGIAKPKPKADPKQVFGEVGLVVVKYTGVELEQEYQGLVTGTWYTFGLVRTKSYIDARDADSILSITEDDKKVFELWQS